MTITKQRKALESALVALSPMEKLFRQVEAANDGPMPASVDCVISIADLRAALYCIGEIREALIDDTYKLLAEYSDNTNLNINRADEFHLAMAGERALPTYAEIMGKLGNSRKDT
jgi:hypothetical protein